MKHALDLRQTFTLFVNYRDISCKLVLIFESADETYGMTVQYIFIVIVGFYSVLQNEFRFSLS